MKQLVSIIISAIFLSLPSFAQDYGPHEPENFGQISKAIPSSLRWFTDGSIERWKYESSNIYNRYRYHKYDDAGEIIRHATPSFDRKRIILKGYFNIDVVSFNSNDSVIYGIRYEIGDWAYEYEVGLSHDDPIYSTHYEIYYISRKDLTGLANLSYNDHSIIFPYGYDPYSQDEDGFIQHYRRYGTYYPNLPEPGRCEWTITEQDGKMVARFTLPYEKGCQLEDPLIYGPYYEIDYKKFQQFQKSVRKMLAE